MDKTITADVLLYVTERLVIALGTHAEAINANTKAVHALDSTLGNAECTIADLEGSVDALRRTVATAATYL
jgi:hypothetical protein